MLRRLYVRNYVLIDSLEIEFPEGLVIITGQTGAGKSIILGSIALALGGKADASIIGEAGDNCVVEAEFDSVSEELHSILDENEVEWDGGHLILRRVVASSGRSRAFVNDSPVSATLLGAISAHLIDIHSQHQTLLLSDRRFQLSVLDYFAGNDALLAECAEKYSRYSSIKSEMEDLDSRIGRIRADKEYNEARFRQLDAAKLKPGEEEELEAEQKQLSNAGEIKENLYAVENYFLGDGVEGSVSVSQALRDSAKRLEKISAFVPAAVSLLERVESCRVEMDDVAAEVSAMNARMDVSEERLQEVESRLSLLYELFTRFSCSNTAQLIEERDRLSEALFDSTALENRREELVASLSRSERELADVADALHEARACAASRFAAEIQDSIRYLELQQAVFEVELHDAAMSASGRDSVLFKFSSTGRNTVEIAKCASGGELSRIMLCLKEMMARFTKMPTMIFDEIDSGVSGSVADKMGEMICRMGDRMQVFAITHLPQVAAKGRAHYLVSRSVDSGRTVTTIQKLSSKDRVLEVARMLSGATVTDTAIANARTLLSY